MKLAIQKIKNPHSSTAGRNFRIDYEDCFQCLFSTKEEVKLKELVLSFFSGASSKTSRLMKLRDAVVKPFGLKTQAAFRETELKEKEDIVVGQRNGLFRVISVSPDIIILGENDQHLDFRIGFFLDRRMSTNEHRLLLSTTVTIHNWTGKIYFFFVKPFHKLLVPRLMKKMVAKHVFVRPK